MDDEKIKVAIQEQREMDFRKLRIMCFGLREPTDTNHADDKSTLKRIIFDVLEIPEETFILKIIDQSEVVSLNLIRSDHEGLGPRLLL